jgi:NADH dehydrogenase
VSGLHVVTGAFGYSGRYLAARLLEAGFRVRTVTNSPGRENPFGDRVEPRPFDFDHPDRLAESLRGAAVLYNTYWVRFNTDMFGHAEAVENTRTLFAAARRAGVGRIVHVSITNPSLDSELEYFRGKAELERELGACGVPHSIVRPAVLFGGEDILVNNIAWMLRRLPVFGVFGDGHYRLEPIHVEDFAALLVREGAESGDRTVDAVGPEAFTYRELVREIGRAIGVRRPIVSIPPSLGYAAAWLLGKLLRDVVLTREEIEGLMQDRLYTGSPPVGQVKLSEWARLNASTLGRRYASELGRRRDRRVAYARAR